MFNFGFNFGYAGGVTPPLLQGDFIWYSLDPDTGFLTEPMRKINDEGNTIMVGASGTHNGTMYSGKSVTLSGDGVIEVPGTTVYVFDYTTNSFISTASPIQNMQIGVIASLDTTQFTQDDLDFFDAMPERIVEWYFGTISIPSGIIRGIEDKVYYPVDGAMIELTYTTGDQLLVDDGCTDISLWEGYQATLTTDGNTITLTNTGGEFSSFRQTQTMDTVNLMEITTNIVSNDGTGNIAISAKNITTDTAGPSTILPNNGIGDIVSFVSIESTGNEEIRLAAKFRAVVAGDESVVDYFGAKKVTSEYILIGGTYILNTRLAYGVQEMRLDMNDAGVPTKVLTNHQIRFRGDGTYVDTGVAIDGSLTDFTAMLGWKQVATGRLQKIASSGGVDIDDNKFELRINADDTISAVLGKNVFDMTPMIDPNSEIHAMCAVYNKATTEILGAVDGSSFTSMGNITFDGATGVVWLGKGKDGESDFDGYIGEGILSATMESEDAWFVFWDKVQLGECDKNKPVGEYLSNHTFDCGKLGWDFDPAYTAEITDNGDGSLHLKTTSNFGSLVPAKLPTESAEWICEVKFRNQVGNGKISFRKPNNVWVSTPTIGDGVHSATYTGVIKELHIGADGDNTYEADYEYISIKKVVTEEVTFDGNLVTFDGEEVTWS